MVLGSEREDGVRWLVLDEGRVRAIAKLGEGERLLD